MNGMSVRGAPDTMKMVMKNCQLRFATIAKLLIGGAFAAMLAGCAVAPGGYYGYPYNSYYAGGYPYYGNYGGYYGYGPSYYSGVIIGGGFGYGYNHYGHNHGYYGYHGYPGYHGHS